MKSFQREKSEEDKKTLSSQPMAMFALYLTKQPWNRRVSVCFCQGLFWKGLVAQGLVCLYVSHTTHNCSQIWRVTATTQNDSAPAILTCVLNSLNLNPWNCRTPGIFNKSKDVGYPVATWTVLQADSRVPLITWFWFLIHNSCCS